METTAAVRLPALLAEFHRRFPAVRLTLRTSTTADLVAGVLAQLADSGFTDVEEVEAVQERMVFGLPRELRKPAEGQD